MLRLDIATWGTSKLQKLASAWLIGLVLTFGSASRTLAQITKIDTLKSDTTQQALVPSVAKVGDKVKASESDSDTIPKGVSIERFPTRRRPDWRPSPRKATLLAIVLPGAGQIYNRRYWKIPLVYAGFGVMTGFVLFNNQRYQEFRDAYILRLKGDRTSASYYDKYSRIESLSIIREGYRRNRDLSVILTGAWYAITVLDAVVDAHLFGFSVTDDLEGKIKPVGLALPSGAIAPGVGLSFHFK